MPYIFDFSVDEGQSFVGIITDADILEKSKESGQCCDVSMPSWANKILKDKKEIPTILVRRHAELFEKTVRIFFRDMESRDRVYNSIKNQIYDQSNRRNTK